MRWVPKPWWLWAGTLFVVAALVAGYLLIPVKESRINHANCEKIQLGMTPKQVIDILGEHPLPTGPTGDLYLAWYDDDGNCIEVRFDGEHGLTSKNFKPSELPVFQRLKWRVYERIEEIWPE